MFPLPDQKQRIEMVKMFFEQYISDTKIEYNEKDFGEDKMKEIASKMEGFSGRQVAKTILAFQSAAFGSGTNKLTVELVDSIIEWKLATIEDDIDSTTKNENKAATY